MVDHCLVDFYIAGKDICGSKRFCDGLPSKYCEFSGFWNTF